MEFNVSQRREADRRHVMIVFGTRPEAIKMIPVVKALRSSSAFRTTVAVTGQHREMLDQVFSVFEEQPDIDLNLMTPGQTLAKITSTVVVEMSELLNRTKPDLVLVHGDTTTAMASAMAAFYAGCSVGHVEAGLRSHDLRRPWPEEFNRVVVDSVADYLFAPTDSARDNLRSEYNKSGRIFVTGNTGVDALLYIANKLDRDPGLRESLDSRYGFLRPDRSLVLVTGHRRESFGPGFERICEGLTRVSRRSGVEILYPVHLNPQVRNVVQKHLGTSDNIHLIAPVDYVDMVYLMKRAKVVVTDSGGIQEEGPALGKPVLVMREVTERPEALKTGIVKLIGTDPALMEKEVGQLLDDQEFYSKLATPVFPYGDGTAAAKITRILEEGA